MTKVACIQLQIKDNETKQGRMKRMDELLDRLDDIDLVLLPEIWATGYFSFDKYMQEAETINGSFVHHYSQKAKQKQIILFAGSFIEKEGEHYYNTSLLFGPDGELLGHYRKTHLFRYGSREGELLTGGDTITVVETPIGKIGLSTCYDLRFPELYRKQIDEGAQLFLVTSAWPHRRLEHWKLFNAVRAVENQCYLVSCNCVGETNGVLLGGHSQIVDPWGVTRAQAGEHETILEASINIEDVQSIRQDFPVLSHRVNQLR